MVEDLTVAVLGYLETNRRSYAYNSSGMKNSVLICGFHA
jgi:hypothetical protein